MLNTWNKVVIFMLCILCVHLNFGFNVDENCISTGPLTQKCYTLHTSNYSVAWSEAVEHCNQSESSIAVDDSAGSRAALEELLTRNSQTTAWIGARSVLLYWNWLTFNEGEHVQIYYQGCYRADNNGERELPVITGRLRWFEGHRKCQILCNSFKYFSLVGSDSKGYTCYCGNTFGSSEHSTACHQCKRDQVCSPDENHNAVYSVNAQDSYEKWEMYHPEGLTERQACIVALSDGNFPTAIWSTMSCNQHLPSYCVNKNPVNHNSCPVDELRGTATGYCYQTFNSSAWYDSVSRCVWPYQPVTITSPLITQDLGHFRWPRPQPRSLEKFWVAGTSYRWVWNNDMILINVSSWPGGVEGIPQADMCIAFHVCSTCNTSQWRSISCSNNQTIHSYVCQKDKQKLFPRTARQLEYKFNPAVLSTIPLGLIVVVIAVLTIILRKHSDGENVNIKSITENINTNQGFDSTYL